MQIMNEGLAELEMVLRMEFGSIIQLYLSLFILFSLDSSDRT